MLDRPYYRNVFMQPVSLKILTPGGVEIVEATLQALSSSIATLQTASLVPAGTQFHFCLRESCIFCEVRYCVPARELRFTVLGMVQDIVDRPRRRPDLLVVEDN